MTEIVVLVSGRGSNFEAVQSAVESGLLKDCRISALVSDRQKTKAAEFAESRSIPVHVCDFKSFSKRDAFDAALLETLESLKPDLILTLGFMRILGEKIVQRFRQKIINIHPSLLPAFPGIQAQKQAFDYGVKTAGPTVHFMDEGLDSGPIILQKAVAVPEGVSEEELSSLILHEEHILIVEAVDLFVKGRLRVEGRRVRILP